MAGKMLSVDPTVDLSAKLHDTRLGAYCEVGARTILQEVAMDDYSYVVNDAQITYTTIGKFCSIAAMTRINPGNHPMHRATQAHFTYRASAYFPEESDDAEFFEWRRSHHVHIGHDVWIGHGAIVLPGRNIGTGAVIEVQSRDDCSVFLRRASDLLLPTIQEPLFRSYPFYLPLLAAAAVEGASFERLETWLCGATSYIAESIEDRGVLVLSLHSLTPALDQLRAAPDPQAPGVYHIPQD